MLIGVGSTTEVLAPLSADRTRQFDVLTRLDAFGTTGLYDAIIAAIDAIQPARGRRALVLLSDGSDRYSTATSAEALARARAADVLVYPIALGRGAAAGLRGARHAHRGAVLSRARCPPAAGDPAHRRRRAQASVPARVLAVETAGRRQQRVAFNRRRRSPQRRDRPRARRLSGEVRRDRGERRVPSPCLSHPVIPCSRYSAASRTSPVRSRRRRKPA